MQRSTDVSTHCQRVQHFLSPISVISDLCKAWEGCSVNFCPLFVRKVQIWKTIQQGQLHYYFNVIRVGERGNEMWDKVHHLCLPQVAWDLDESNLCKDRNVCWDLESEIYSAKNVRVTYRLLKYNKLCFIGGVKHCSNKWKKHNLCHKELWCFRTEEQNIQVSRNVCAIMWDLPLTAVRSWTALAGTNMGTVIPLPATANLNGEVGMSVSWQSHVFSFIKEIETIIKSEAPHNERVCFLEYPR